MADSVFQEDTPTNTWCDTEVKATMHSVEEFFEDLGVDCRARTNCLQSGQEYNKEVCVPCPNAPQVAQQSSNARFCTKGDPNNVRVLSWDNDLMTLTQQHNLSKTSWIVYGLFVDSLTMAAIADILHTHWTSQRPLENQWFREDMPHPASVILLVILG